MSSQFYSLNNKANILKNMGLVYKQRLETRSSDLSKAEAEVCNQKNYIIYFAFVMQLETLH